MYNNNNNNSSSGNSSHPDRFAGQYPPPPPLQSPVTEQPSNAVYNNTYPSFSTPLQHQQQAYIPPLQQQQAYIPPPQQQQQQQQQEEAYIPPPAPILNDTDYYTHQPHYSQQPQHSNNDYYDHSETAQTSLDAYLRQEREEYLKHEPKAQDTIPLTQQDPEKAPMLKPEYQPYVAKPTLAPQNEAEGYKYTPYEPRRNKSCSCCCYNPAITCCSFFMLLISIAFCASGIALIIASKVISSKCNNNCSSVSDSVASACDTFCNTVLQNGLFYGGIVVAGLAGIAIIWKLVMWTCAGYSQRH